MICNLWIFQMYPYVSLAEGTSHKTCIHGRFTFQSSRQWASSWIALPLPRKMLRSWMMSQAISRWIPMCCCLAGLAQGAGILVFVLVDCRQSSRAPKMASWRCLARCAASTPCFQYKKYKIFPVNRLQAASVLMQISQQSEQSRNFDIKLHHRVW